jgi:threonine dehydrogenase-like Zn-dependent dehydrogenase
VLECVRLTQAVETALGVVGDGGTVSRVGAPQYEQVMMCCASFLSNITFTDGVVSARAYIEELLLGVLEGTIEPGRVFDRTVGLDEFPDGYRVMAAREALKVLIQP